MVADSVTFHDVAPETYGSVRDRLVTVMAGVEPEGEPDVIEFYGVRGKLSYDEQARRVGNVPDDGQYMGYPAWNRNQWLRAQATLRHQSRTHTDTDQADTNTASTASDAP